MYALPSYAFIAKDYVTQAALYTHHQYIAGFLMVGAFAHGAIFFVRADTLSWCTTVQTAHRSHLRHPQPLKKRLR